MISLMSSMTVMVSLKSSMMSLSLSTTSSHSDDFEVVPLMLLYRIELSIHGALLQLLSGKNSHLANNIVKLAYACWNMKFASMCLL